MDSDSYLNRNNIADIVADFAEEKIPTIGILGKNAPDFALKLSRKLRSSDVVKAYQNNNDFFKAAEKQKFDFVILTNESLSSESSLLLRQLKLLEHDPGVLVVSSENDNPEQLVKWLQAGADRVVLDTERLADDTIQQITILERGRRAHEIETLSRARSSELLKRMSAKASRFEEFGMTVAHDIRGPLGNIQMQLEYVLDSFPDEMPLRCKQVLEKVIGNAERLQHMVQGMYQYAKFGAQAAKKSLVVSDQLIQTVISDLNIDERLDVTIELCPLPNIWGNAELLRRVFINIITNAVKYNNKKESIIRISGTTKTDRTIGTIAILSIEDNGPGIPVEKRAEMLSMFQRGDPDNSDGLGVGLSVVCRICELHFGQVYIEDSSLGGAKIVLELPVESIL